MQRIFARVANSPTFNNLVLAAILIGSITVGIETYESSVAQYKTLLASIDHLIIGIFIIEVVVKIGAAGRHPERYF